MLGRLGSGEVVVDRARTHLDPILRPLIGEALAQIQSLQESYLQKTIRFTQPIGWCLVVRTHPGDKILLRTRENRLGKSRFVRNRRPRRSRWLTIVLKKAREPDTYVLITVYIGKWAPPEPFDPRADAIAKQYWKTHAFVDKRSIPLSAHAKKGRTNDKVVVG